MKKIIVSASMAFFFVQPAFAENPDFNTYITKAVSEIYQNRKGGGYDINRAFTQDLDYGTEKVKMSPATSGSAPYPTMCVAAVAEVIIYALNLYNKDHPEDRSFERLKVKTCNSGNIKSVRANLFMYQGTGSFGTAGTLQKFGIGKQIPFPELRPGDFINLNRAKSGHAVVFLKYLDSSSNETLQWSPGVIGFKYFSAQGKGRPDAGFAYRYAYFDGKCPAAAMGVPRDCGVIKSNNQRLLNTGRMFGPKEWRIEDADASLIRSISRSVEGNNPTARGAALDALVAAELNKELSPRTDDFLNGETTD